MRIIFVRHGHPNYQNDCLTELGHQHAEAASLRLADEGISEIYSSSCGRAVETAQHTADKLGLSITQYDFMRELRWGSIDEREIFHNGHPWLMAQNMVENGQETLRADWRETEPFCRNRIVENVDSVGRGIDEWLQMLGYTREGAYYRVTGDHTDRTVAMFSHAGSSSAALAHMFNLPFPYFCVSIVPNFTAVTIVTLSDAKGDLTAPMFEIVSDARHIAQCENVISN